MIQVLNLIGIGIISFISTNIDDFFITTNFFIAGKYPPRQIVFGKYIGILLLITVSCIGYFFKLIIPIQWIGLLGILPIAIGIRHVVKLVKAKKGTEEVRVYEGVNEEPQVTETSQIVDESAYTKKGYERSGVLIATIITFSNGGDNIGVYIPLFASLNLYELIFIISAFLIMVGIWCAISYYFVNNKYIGIVLKKYGEPCFPFVLIILGIYILIKCKTFTLLY